MPSLSTVWTIDHKRQLRRWLKLAVLGCVAITFPAATAAGVCMGGAFYELFMNANGPRYVNLLDIFEILISMWSFAVLLAWIAMQGWRWLYRRIPY